ERTKKVAADDTNLSTQSQATLIRQLTDLLLYRLSQPNNAEKILFTESCDTVASKSELACTDYSCPRGINPDPAARVKNMLMSPNLSLTTDQRELILTMGRTIPESDVIILSASSENHYDEMQAMFQNLHTVVYHNMANFTMVLFDIGLTKEQRSTTERNCKCHVVTFPVHLFKAYMKNNFCYAWKPLIVLASIVKARKYLVYQDASVRWLNDFHITFDRTNKYGHQMFRYRNSIRSTLNTYQQMFQFMDEDPCTFTPYPEFHATSMLHKNDQLVIKTVLEPWARCALEETCMCPVEPSKSIVCKRDSFIQHRCHRFDQSAITLIMGKMYGDDIYRFLAPAGDTVGKKCLKETEIACTNYSCPRGINPDPGARVRNMVMSPKFSLSTDQREMILTMGKTIPESDVIILSVSSENHYAEMQAMFQNLHTVVYPNMTERKCRCHVVTFLGHLFKPYIKNNLCYAWKPLIVLTTVLKARKYLVYQDTSVRWSDGYLSTFDRAEKFGHQIF
ncbi:hypothetical protein BgiBS90_001020, partial [Biomphalaria glabrata]